MRSTTCDAVCVLIDREAIGWTEAERLRVEQHLGECSDCSETLSLSRFVRSTLQEAAGELSEGARSRAIRSAIEQGGKRRHNLRVQAGWPRWTLGLSVAAAAAGLAIWLGHTPASQVVATPSQRPIPAAHEQPGALAKVTPQATSEASDEPIVVESAERESHTFAHAHVTFAPNTRARFEPSTRTLSLEHGALDVDVDPMQGRSFAVTTQHFRVEVLGTRFSVSNETVWVQHGRVRVLGTNGDELVSALGAGETFSYTDDKPARPAKRAQASEKPAALDAKALLSEARAALMRDDRAAARALIKKAESTQAGRGERAEAGTLRAEILLLEQDGAAALTAYREVATKYGELAAGENAAFAAAQLAAKVAPNEARALLEGYLARYPKGRFVDQANKRLSRLGTR